MSAQNKFIFHYKYLIILSTLFVTTSITSVAVSYRLTSLGSFLLPGGVYIFPFSYFIGDIIAEIYGYKYARQLIWAAAICGYVFSIITSIVIHLPHPSFWNHENDFLYVFGNSLRFVVAGSIAGITSSFINAFIISKTKIYMHGRLFWLRSFCATTCGEIMLTAILYSSAFLGVIPLQKMIPLIVSGIIFKLSLGVIIVVPTTIAVGILKKNERLDTYDIGVKFNPFSMEI